MDCLIKLLCSKFYFNAAKSKIVYLGTENILSEGQLGRESFPGKR